MPDAKQFELFEAAATRDLQALWTFLNTGSRQPVSIVLTRNRVTMCSVAFNRDGRVRVRLHEAFLRAPDAVIEALRGYLRSRRREDWDPVAVYARNIRTDPGPPARRLPHRSSRVHDLAAIATDVNQRYFSGGIRYRIEWGRERPRRRPRRGRSRSIRFGAWHPATQTIRIHPLLDDARVPAFFVAFIVFHEMLHAVVPSRESNGRRYDHTPEFRKLEQGFEEFPRCRELATQLLDVLL